MYQIVFTNTAKDSFCKLDRKLQKIASKGIERLKINPKIGKPLIGSLKGFWRLRFSNYRIIYRIKEDELIIIVFDIGHRKNIYD